MSVCVGCANVRACVCVRVCERCVLLSTSTENKWLNVNSNRYSISACSAQHKFLRHHQQQRQRCQQKINRKPTKCHCIWVCVFLIAWATLQRYNVMHSLINHKKQETKTLARIESSGASENRLSSIFHIAFHYVHIVVHTRAPLCVHEVPCSARGKRRMAAWMKFSDENVNEIECE